MRESLEIAQLGNPILRQQAQLVDNLSDPHLQQLIDKLLTTVG